MVGRIRDWAQSTSVHSTAAACAQAATGSAIAAIAPSILANRLIAVIPVPQVAREESPLAANRQQFADLKLYRGFRSRFAHETVDPEHSPLQRNVPVEASNVRAF
jgi:hypothetical protein